MVGGEDDQRVVEAAKLLQMVEQAAEPVIDLRDQAHVGRAHVTGASGRSDEAQAFFVLTIGRQHGMLVRSSVLRAAHEGQAVLSAVHRVIGRGRHVRPVRLDVAKMQEPRLSPCVDESHRALRRVM